MCPQELGRSVDFRVSGGGVELAFGNDSNGSGRDRAADGA